MRPPAYLLAVWEPSPLGANAAWRAALIARELQVPMRLLDAPLAAVAAWPPAPIARVVKKAEQRLRLHITLQRVQSDPLVECLTAARAGLLVVPSAGNPLRERVMGVPAERLIRLAPGPVLVVKRTVMDTYGRVLVPADLCEGSGLLLEAAAALAPASATAVFHSLRDAGAEPAGADPRARYMRARRARLACQGISSMLASVRNDIADSTAACAAPVPVVAFGPATEAILAAETAHRPDLIVLGKACGSRFAHFLLGDVTQHVLEKSEADVLVVPGSTRGCAGTRSDRSAGAAGSGCENSAGTG